MHYDWTFLISTPSSNAIGTFGTLSTDRLLILSGKVVEEPYELFHLVDPAEITLTLLKRAGPWSVIYHRPDLNRVFVGRDVFGRLSLVFAPINEDVIISEVVRSTPNIGWNEVPYAQVCCVDTNTCTAVCSTYLSAYPDNVLECWSHVFKSFTLQYVATRKDLLKISRSAVYPRQKALDDFFERLVDAVRSMAPQDVNSVAVAFSGGVDSLLITIALHKACQLNQSIDLVNVAFIRDSEHCSLINDRQRAVVGLHYLRSTYTDRKWRLILVDVTKDELEANRSNYIAKAAAPMNTVLDESLACVLWFALRGIGKDFDSDDNSQQRVRSDADIYFVGSGADELFAGYARHRTRFECGGIDSLVEECESELHRIGNRNGGRDARVAAVLMKELRAPFLHDSFVAWVNTLPMEVKCDLTLPRGVGEKLIIRQVLAQLGAPHNAPKQAMQFGSGFVKMQGDKTLKGNSVSRHLCTSDQPVHRDIK